MKRSEQAYELAYRYERELGACAQPVIKALQEIYGEKNDVAFKGLTGFSAGGANQTDGICGAYAAGIFYLSLKIGRSADDMGKNTDDPNAVAKLYENFDLVKKLQQTFVQEYGSVICEHIMRKQYGRSYHIEDDDEFKKFDAAGAHDTIETSICGNAAKWIVEILEEMEVK